MNEHPKLRNENESEQMQSTTYQMGEAEIICLSSDYYLFYPARMKAEELGEGDYE